MKKRAAHFLLLSELLHSPPNNAIINAYIEQGYHVDVFTPGNLPITTRYGRDVTLFPAEYSWIWILKNLIRKRWLFYSFVSGTSEDPLCIVGLMSSIYRKRSICLVDEIKSGSYRGDRSNVWKALCKKAIRNSHLRIVNDESRIELLRQYIGLESKNTIIVYPGCYYQRPERSTSKRKEHRESWGFNNDEFVIGSSGGFNMTSGADWLVEYIQDDKEVRSVIQPLGVSPLSLFLLNRLECSDRIYIQEKRMDWHEAWESAQGLDAGICIYMNQAPQFQNMGISSNRLCMFIAMGVPVIALKQKSFNFIEQYECGILVENYEEFKTAVKYIKHNLEDMRTNCEQCYRGYIKSDERYRTLSRWVNHLGTKRL